MSAAEADRGMRAVERVRGVRERDSRIGLQQALVEQERHRARLVALEDRLASASGWQEGDTWAYLALRGSLTALGEAIGEAGKSLEAATQISRSAHAHWSSDKTRLSAVESLLERRAEARRAEIARVEVRELDDISAQLWIRDQRSSQPQADQTQTTDPEVAR